MPAGPGITKQVCMYALEPRINEQDLWEALPFSLQGISSSVEGCKTLCACLRAF